MSGDDSAPRPPKWKQDSGPANVGIGRGRDSALNGRVDYVDLAERVVLGIHIDEEDEAVEPTSPPKDSAQRRKRRPTS